MKRPPALAARPLRSLVALSLVLFCLGGHSLAQTDAATDGSTPSGLKPGSPAGSYSLSGFDNVNPYSGHLDFRLPLLKVGGRGGAGYTMTLGVEQKWLVEHLKYMEDTGLHGHRYFPNPYWWGSLRVGLGPGVMQIRGSGHGSYNCTYDLQCFSYTYTRLTFTGGDGTEYELVDQQTGGRPEDCSTGQCGSGFNRGKVFVTADGTTATFLSDTDILDPVYSDGSETDTAKGYLILRDGTRYRFDGGLMSWMQDRNGNRTSFTYVSPYDARVTGITDSLGRQVTVEYGVTYLSYGTGTKITYKGVGGVDRVIFLAEGTLESSLRQGYVKQTFKGLFQVLDGSTSSYFNPTVVHSVYLPDGRKYQLSYNSHGEVARAVLPTGGAIEYDHAAGVTNGDASGAIIVGGLLGGGLNRQIYRRVVERRTYKNSSDTTPESTMTFSRPESVTGGSITTSGYVDVDQRAGTSIGALLSRTRHHYQGSAVLSLKQKPGAFPGWREGREYKSEVMGADGTTVLRRTEQTWQQRASVSWWSWWVSLYPGLTQDDEPANDPRLVTTVTTVEPSGANLVAKQTAVNPQTGAVGFDQFNNQTDVWEYDFGVSAAPARPLRHTHTDYVGTNNGIDYTDHNGAHIRSLPSAQRVYSVNPSTGDETLVAQSETRYDEATYAPAPPCDPDNPAAECPAVPQWADPGTAARGNPTTVRRWLDTTNAWVETHAQHDRLGNLRKSWDAKGNLSRVDYADSFSDGVTTRNTFAFPTAATSPVPDPTGYYGSMTALVTTTVYDFSTGLVTSTTDANGKITTVEYNDPLDRPTKVSRPDAGWTSYDYDHNQYGDYLRTRTKLNTAGVLTDAYQYFDGLGRPYRSQTYENQEPGAPWLTADTAYDALGRVIKASLPYRSAGGDPPLDEVAWATRKRSETTYDALGRVKTVTSWPDQATVMTSYSGQYVTVTDQAGKVRRSKTDALGRLVRVDEPNAAGGLGTTDAPAQPTAYTYDALGNLRKVDQGGQLRFFMYDSLGRLIRAKNPEQGAFTPDGAGGDFPSLSDSTSGTANDQWSVGYGYDAGGNLFKRKDARNVTTTYGYDALNRNTTVRYTDATLPLDRYYDGATNGKGRPWYWYNYASGSGTLHVVGGYDAMGRPRSQTQQFYVGSDWGAAFSVGHTYDLAGNVTEMTYPSQRTVSYTYDAAGRLATFSGNLGDGTLRTYSSEARYHELGGREQERFGTQIPVYNKGFYNSRGQLSQIRVGTIPITDPDPIRRENYDRGAIINHYSYNVWAGSDQYNNGNLKKQDNYIPDGQGNESVTTQYYDYDSLNRLDYVREERGGATQWRQDYAYDRWGNRTVDAAGTWLGNSSQPPSDLIPEKQFSVITVGGVPTTNRLEVPAGQPGAMTYDASGNLAFDSYSNFAGGGARAYDAEGRMTSAQYFDSQVRTAAYAYDADGRRVRRQNGLGVETWQVYGLGGELLAEYAAGALPSAPQKEYGYRAGELLVTAEGGGGGGGGGALANVALASNGGVASASSTNASYSLAAVNNGDRKGPNHGGVWGDSTSNVYPDWVQIDFPGSKAIDEVAVVSMQDNYASPLEPTEAMTGTSYVVSNFVVEYWTGAAWAAVPSGAVTGNNKIWRRVTFPQVTTTKIRVVINQTGDNYSQVAEVEAWGAGAGQPAGGGVRWLVSDQLGTPRMVIDQSGSLTGVKRHDYLPFGEEIVAEIGGRTTNQGYGQVDHVRQKFTGYERDGETGLDYAGARYYSSMMGRFNSPDVFWKDSQVSDPGIGVHSRTARTGAVGGVGRIGRR